MGKKNGQVRKAGKQNNKIKTTEKLDVWYARTNKSFSSIRYYPLEHNKGVLFFSKDSTITDPNWTIRFGSNTYTYDQVQMVVMLKDTLLAHKSRAWIRMGSQVYGFSILGCYGLEGLPALSEQVNNPAYFRLYIENPEFDGSEEINFTDARVRIENYLLPKHLYRYGFCNQFNGRFMECSDKQYVSFFGSGHTAGLRYTRCEPTPTTSGGFSHYNKCSFQAGP